MTIQRAIELLTALKEKYGDIEIFYDCEHCKKITRPESVVAMAQMTQYRVENKK